MSAAAAQELGAAPAPAVPEHARFPLVDGVRAIAALTIFAYHCSFHLGYLTHGYGVQLLNNLNVGVPIFFVVSGFLLYRPFAAARLRGGPPPRLRNYAVRRALRIVPAYWIALPLVTLLLGLQHDVFTPIGIVRYFGFLQIYDAGSVVGGIGQAWTLCVEVSFYAALPLWALLARRARRGGDARAIVRAELLGLALIWLASVGWKIAFEHVLDPGDSGYLSAQLVLPAMADQFALGMALAVLSAAASHGIALPRPLALLAQRPGLALLGALALFTTLGLQSTDGGSFSSATGIGRVETKALIGVLILIPAVFGALRGGPVRRALGARPLLQAGLISYSFYLWHLALILKLGRWDALREHGRGWVIVLALLGSVLVALFSYHLIEAPAMRAGRRLTRRPAASG